MSLPAAAWSQTQYTGYGDPTAAEQQVLELINRARANPTAEGARLATMSPYPLPGGNIAEGLANPGNVGPRPPLTMNSILLSTARAHSQDMWTNNYFAHDSAGGTVTFAQRLTAAGYAYNWAGENIAKSTSGTAAFLEDFLMVDWSSSGGYPNRGHRVNLLDVDSAGAPFREIGVGYYSGASSKSVAFKDLLTQDFGRRNSVGPFVLGVVYNDSNANNFYDPGEGLSGVTIQLNPAGASYAVSASAGGYAFLASTAGSITVRATGGPFGANVVSKTVTPAFPGENVKVDFKLSEAGLTDSDADGLPDSWEMANFGNLSHTAAEDFDGDGYSNLEEFNAGSDPKVAASTPLDTDGDGLPDAWELAHFGNLAQIATGNPDGDAFDNLAEYTAGTDPMNNLSFPGSGSTTAPKKNGGGGGCGLSGLEGILLLALLRRVRRA
jgi:hypothetical protein